MINAYTWQILNENSWIPACRPIDTNLEIMLEFLITIAGNFSYDRLHIVPKALSVLLLLKLLRH